MSFKVSRQDGERERGPRDEEGERHHDDRERRRGTDERRDDDDDAAEPMDQDEEDVDVEDDGMDDEMAAMMGFGGFGTTKNKKVVGNNLGAVRKEKKTEYRQYMNRVGGFNRPLSPGR
ncbi:hypothetical protein Daus18300_001011 [Diaporthe australafricana]|uniref:U4/U6.U5 small nuclear ribonucleoprotein 27kDa protein domain-containing protein n=1 Tax=Diaporthe australafricana TaxID=127596 RepID=A0ABR3Y0Z0_9PEZI